jgi:tetratricopeptide (TPR) repeat protein
MKLAALTVLTFALLLLARPASADPLHTTVCQLDTQPKAVTDSWTTFKSDPNALAGQLGFADALINQGCYKDALNILEAGVAQRPRSSELQSRLRAVRSMLSEEHFFEGLGTAQEAAKYQHDLLRCTKASDVSACDDALRSKPDDPQLLVAKGDAFLHGGRAADALGVYRHASELKPDDESIKAKLADAESQRQALASKCQGDADAAAVEACQAALLRGAPDEFVLLKRKGILLQSVDQPEQALDAFIAADMLKQDDKSVALAIVALTDSTGRKDALALAARGTALLTLGRAAESLTPLRAAQTLAPALPGIKVQLARAEQAARAEAKRQARTASAKPSSTQPGAAGTPNSNARVAATATVTYSNDASAGSTN